MVSSGSKNNGHIVKQESGKAAEEISQYNQPLSDTVMAVCPAAQWFL